MGLTAEERAPKVPINLSFDMVQRIGLVTGLVDIKIRAINEIWSVLHFIVRVKDRAAEIINVETGASRPCSLTKQSASSCAG